MFDNPEKFVLTPFLIPVRSKGESTRKYFEMSQNQSFVKGHDKWLLGRLYHLHDELSLHNMIRIAKRDNKSKKLGKVDLKLVQSTYVDG